MKINQTIGWVMSAMFLALGLLFPGIFHFFGAASGQAFLPMHIPVFICGLFCGPNAGIFPDCHRDDIGVSDIWGSQWPACKKAAPISGADRCYAVRKSGQRYCTCFIAERCIASLYLGNIYQCLFLDCDSRYRFTTGNRTACGFHLEKDSRHSSLNRFLPRCTNHAERGKAAFLYAKQK